MLLFFYCDILNNLFYWANNILRTSFNRLERGDNGGGEGRRELCDCIRNNLTEL